MVNRVDGNRYYEYTRTQNLSVSDTDEKFSLDYKQKELTGEKSQKDKDVPEQEKQKAAEQTGVRVDISYGKTTDAKPKQTAPVKERPDTASGQTLLSMIQDIFRTAIDAFKGFFDKIWNEPETDKAALDSAVLDSAEEKQPDASEMMDAEVVRESEEPSETAESFYQKEARLNQET